MRHCAPDVRPRSAAYAVGISRPPAYMPWRHLIRRQVLWIIPLAGALESSGFVLGLITRHGVQVLQFPWFVMLVLLVGAGSCVCPVTLPAIRRWDHSADSTPPMCGSPGCGCDDQGLSFSRGRSV